MSGYFHTPSFIYHVIKWSMSSVMAWATCRSKMRGISVRKKMLTIICQLSDTALNAVKIKLLKNA